MQTARLGQFSFLSDLFFPTLELAPAAWQAYQAKRAADRAKQDKERAEAAAEAARAAQAEAEAQIEAFVPSEKILGLDPMLAYAIGGGVGLLIIGTLLLRK